MTVFKMQALLLFKIRNLEITATEERVCFSQLPRDGATSHHTGAGGRERKGAKCG